MTDRPSLPRRMFSGAMRGIEFTRRLVGNLLFLLILIFLFAVLTRSAEPVHVPEGTAVLFDPVGWIVEDYDAAPVDRALDRALGDERPQVLLHELRRGLERAADDERVSVIVLDLRALAPVSLTKLEELVEPLMRARENGKRVVAFASFFGQSQYLLAAHADEVYTDPMGGVFIEGYGAYRMYMREALDTLSIDWHVFKTGDYKSFAENYERDDMSAAAREQMQVLLDQMWSRFSHGVESARGLEEGALAAYIEGMAAGMPDAGGDFARYAETHRLVDGLVDDHGLRARLIELVGVAPWDDEDYQRVHWQAYLAEGGPNWATGDRIALVVARGAIVEGDPGLHVMGSHRITSLIREAADNPRVKALVLRVDSGGGSAFASEQIRAEVDRFRASGRPVVVSMSSVAASGGYWISMSADRIFATPATITGSIGVVGMFPNFTRAMDRIGLHTDGVGTTPLAGALRPDMPLTDATRNIIQASIESVYSDFLAGVAEGRGLDIEVVRELAGGRVWTGTDALEAGLVDELGGLDDALASAAELAGLEEWSVQEFQRSPTFNEQMLIALLDARVTEPLARHMAQARNHPLAGLFAWVERELSWALSAGDPRHVYLHCFCDAP